MNLTTPVLLSDWPRKPLTMNPIPPSFSTAGLHPFRNKKMKELSIHNPEKVVQFLFKEMAKQDITQLELSQNVGMSKDTLKDWRIRTMPRVNDLNAALNMLGYELHPVKIKDVSAKKEQERFNRISKCIQEKYSVTLNDLLSRRKNSVDARHELMAKLYMQGMTYSKIGRLMHKDHSTVMHGCKQYWKKKRA